MALPNVTPMELVQQTTPFDHPDWLFEIKYDGFRSLADVEDGCRLISRNEFH
jgi:bifunctional non-homologous end joining protein LigD